MGDMGVSRDLADLQPMRELHRKALGVGLGGLLGEDFQVK